jgi:hypothetical protein
MLKIAAGHTKTEESAAGRQESARPLHDETAPDHSEAKQILIVGLIAVAVAFAIAYLRYAIFP